MCSSLNLYWCLDKTFLLWQGCTTSLNWKMCSNFATFKKAAQVFGQRKNVDSFQCSCSKLWKKTFSIFRQHIGMNFMICEKEGFTAACFFFFAKTPFQDVGHLLMFKKSSFVCFFSAKQLCFFSQTKTKSINYKGTIWFFGK